jgi:transglutaminase-like putative cysteine protease
MDQKLELYTLPTYFIDSNHPAIIAEANKVVSNCGEDDIEKAKALFYYVRDEYAYYTYDISLQHPTLKASYILLRAGKKHGFCISKSVLYAALCRAVNIPNRLVFCNVKNHIAVDEIMKLLGSDLLVFHGYNEVYLNDKWVKCTVAFNKELCHKLNVNTLEFDGYNDYIFQEYDKEGGQFMLYEKDYGPFHELPFDMWMFESKKYYPKLFEHPEKWASDNNLKKTIFNMQEYVASNA